MPLAAQPTIAQVTTDAANGTYPAGSEINITVSFSEAVTMASNTSLNILLETGSFDRSISIATISGQESVSEKYVVQSGDASDDLTVSLITLVSSDGKPASITGDVSGQALTDASIPSGKNLANLHDIRVDGAAPSAPTGVSAAAGEGSVTLTWNQNSEGDLSQYFVYAGTNYPDTKVATLTGVGDTTAILKAASAEDPLTADVTYYFHITATDTFSQESTSSQIVSATPYLTPVRQEVNDVSTPDSDWWNSTSQFTGTWLKFQDNGTLTYECAIGSSTESLDDVAPWTYVDTDTQATLLGLSLTEGATYTFSVRGTDNTSRSDIGTSDGFTVDVTAPTSGVVYDGPGDDIDYTATTDSIAANWGWFSDGLSGIKEYKYSLYRTDTILPLLDRLSSGLSTAVTLDTTLTEGKRYRFAVIAIDSAGNISTSVKSNGVSVDLTPPSAGTVVDIHRSQLSVLDTDDRDWSTDSTELAALWYGFSDGFSGIDIYQVAVGDSSDAADIAGWSNVGDNGTVTEALSYAALQGLDLTDATTYTFFVRAVDYAGNVSDSSFTDGITVDLSLPKVAKVSPDTTSLLGLTDTTEIDFKFTEALASVSLTITPKHTPEVSFKTTLSDSVLNVAIFPSIVSHDTLTFLFTGLTDLRDLVTDTVRMEFHAQLLGDFDDNLRVDISDITTFAAAWPSTDIAPVTGNPPFFFPAPDGKSDLRDALAFARMWRWSNETNVASSRAVSQIGEPLQVAITESGFSVTLPRGAQSGELAVQPDGNSVRLLNPEASESGLFFSARSGDGNRLLVNFALFESSGAEKETKLSFSLDGTRHGEIHLKTTFYDKSRQIISSGAVTLFDTPLPTTFALHQNSPNPFNPVTEIAYDVPERSHVEIVVYDLLGRRVRTIVDEERAAGFHSALWSGTDDTGRPIASGTFILRMRSGAFTEVRKMVVLR